MMINGLEDGVAASPAMSRQMMVRTMLDAVA
jgi:hypothetical protein